MLPFMPCLEDYVSFWRLGATVFRDVYAVMAVMTAMTVTQCCPPRRLFHAETSWENAAPPG